MTRGRGGFGRGPAARPACAARHGVPGAVVAGVVVAAAVLALVAGAGPAGARTLGLRGGFSIGPAQWVVGAHQQLLGDESTVGVVPSVEAGFGDDAFSLTGQGDVVYRFPHTAGPRPYVGGGAAVYYLNPSHEKSRFDGGVNAVGGVVLDPSAHPRITLDGRVRLSHRLPKARVVVALEF